MFDFVFRFDAHGQIGGGHFQRALALIQILTKRGFSVACCGDYAPDYQQRLRAYQLPFFPKTSALETRCLVFDYYGDFDAFIESGVSFQRMVVFEDLPARGHSRANLVINAFGELDDLEQRYPAATILCGVEYILFREHVHALRNKGSDQYLDSNKPSVLVSLGGTDQSATLYRILTILSELLETSVEIKVLSPVALKVPDRCLLHVGYVDDFLERALDSDLIICGLGQTFLEMQALGKASIGVKLADNQAACAKCLAGHHLNIIDSLDSLEIELAACLEIELPERIKSIKSRVRQIQSDPVQRLPVNIRPSQSRAFRRLLGAKEADLIEQMVAQLT